MEKSGIFCAAPSSEYAVSDDYSAGAAGSSTLTGSSRAWLLPFSPPIMMRTYVLEGRQNLPFKHALSGDGVLGYEMLQTRPSGGDFMPK